MILGMKDYKKKIQRDRDANMAKYNFAGSCNMGGYDFMNNTSHDKYVTDEEYQQMEEQKHFLDSRPYYSDYSLNVRNPSCRTYDNHPAKIQYKQYVPWERANREPGPDLNTENSDFDKLQFRLNNFKTKTNRIYQFPEDMDNNYFQSSYETNSSSSVPLRGKGVQRMGGTRDVDVENCLIKGLPERNAKAKSFGYPNYSDHSFDFISDDIQDPKHVVMQFPRGGESSRLDKNFKSAKPYKREIF